MKDLDLDRTPCYNVADLFEHFLKFDASYYELKLVDFGNGIFSNYIKKTKCLKTNIREDQISEICAASGVYMVQSEKDEETYYNVDMRWVWHCLQHSLIQ